MSFNQIHLAKGKKKALQRQHPWVYSGAFKQIPSHLREGEVVEILDEKENFQALGFFHPGRIAVRILSFEPVHDINLLITQRISEALAYRQYIGVLDQSGTSCCRLVFGEGDLMPGLIVDRYNDTAVVQLHHSGWQPYLENIANALVQHQWINQVYCKPTAKIEAAGQLQGWLIGNGGESITSEHGIKFKIDWEEGQKTGFFIDQRENRRRLGELSKGRTVLNTFSYTGGFSIYALMKGASRAVSVDISEAAVQLAHENAILNEVSDRHEAVAADVFDYLDKMGDQFDIIVLDPPAFSKSKRTTHKAVQAYKRLNRAAIHKIKPGGLIFTFSCSQHVGSQLFEDTVRAAAIGSGKTVRVMEKLTQPADHPVNLYHPEGEYLKGLILRVD